MEFQEREERKAQYLRAVFDAIPQPAFVVDEDVRIHDFNTAAEALLGPEPAAMLHRRSGEALHCIHSEVNGCGRSEPCRDCVVRNSVTTAISGGSVCRKLHQAELRTRTGTTPIDLLVTANLLPYTEPPKAVLILENVTETIQIFKTSDAGHVC